MSVGKEGRVSLLACAFLLCEQLLMGAAALSDGLVPGDVASNRTPAACQHLVIQPNSSSEKFLLLLVDLYRCVLSLSSMQSTQSFFVGFFGTQLFIKINMQCYYQFTSAELILAYTKVSWKPKEIKFQLKIRRMPKRLC